SRAELQLAVAAEAALGRLEFAGELADAAAGWRGRLDRLQLVPSSGPTLGLVAPAAFRIGERLQLDRACLVASEPGGQLCASADGRRFDIDGEDLPLALLQPWL